MQTNFIIPDPSHLKLEKMTSDGENILIFSQSVSQSMPCPLCMQPSNRVHSRYCRMLSDLPWAGISAYLYLGVRRFFCDIGPCSRRIFTERLAQVAAPYSRQTNRLAQVIRSLAYEAGGKGGAKLAINLGIRISHDTLIRQVYRAPKPEYETPKALGVDDFAFKKGQNYGTILVDLERHVVIDLLEDRTAETLAQWLIEHPGIEIISRDRAGAYASGAKKGASDAVQVADRWHLLKNLGDTLERLLNRHHAYLGIATESAIDEAVAKEQQKLQEKNQQEQKPPDATQNIASQVNLAQNQEGCEQENSKQKISENSDRPKTKAQKEQQVRRERRMAQYNEVIKLHEQGMKIRAIARKLKIGRETVTKLIAAGQFPEQAPRQKRGSKIDPFKPYLSQRWEEGCDNAFALWQEIKAKGFAGSDTTVRRFIAKWREDPCISSQGQPLRKKLASEFSLPSPRKGVWLLIGKEEDLKLEDRTIRDKLYELCPEIFAAAWMAYEFGEIVRNRRVDLFEEWMETASQICTELKNFVIGLRQNIDAVKAALTLKWSNGQTEGQVNRLKMIKRRMYGRASFDLLRKMVVNKA